MLIGNNINLAKNELQNARIQNLAAAPGSPVQGQIYADTVLNQFGYYNGTTWVYLAAAGAAAAGTLTGTTLASNVVTSSLTTVGTIATGVWNGTVILGLYGGTGVANSGKTITLGGNLTTSGAFATTLTSTATTTVTLPTTGTLTTLAGTEVFTNKDLTSGTNTFPTFTAAAGTLTGTTLNATVVTSSLTTVGTIGTGTWQGTVVAGLYGGTGVANSGKTITLGGNLTTSGAFATTLTATATTTVTLPTTGTLATLAGVEAFTNKTIDANGTGNSITNLEVADFASNVVDTDGTLAANSATRIPSQSAVVTYVQANIQGVAWKAPVRAATSAAGTLATSFENGDVIDGVTLATGDRILLKDQAAPADNGIYVVAASGAPARAADANISAEVLNFVVSVQEGTLNADKTFVNSTNAPITLGSTGLTIVDFVTTNVPTATTSVQGKVYLATLAEAEAKTDTVKAVVSADLLNFPIKKTFTIGDGVTTAIVVTHNLGTKDITASVRDASTDAFILVDVAATSTTTATITFAVAPTTNAYKVVIIG